MTLLREFTVGLGNVAGVVSGVGLTAYFGYALMAADSGIEGFFAGLAVFGFAGLTSLGLLRIGTAVRLLDATELLNRRRG